MYLSIVVPVYNEEESLPQLYQEICEVAETNRYELEIIFIDDGSKDRSWEIVEQLATQDERVRGIRFRRNFGKAAALNAGFETAQGKIVLTMDADLQDDPHEIPEFITMMESGLEVISGWKKIRHDPWHKVIPSRFFNAMVSYMTGVCLHDHNCGMKCYRREIFDEIVLYGELHRFVPVLASARGYRVGEKVVAHRSRQFGQSKYGFTRFIKGFLDLFTVWFLTGYGQRPQHLMGTVGLIAMGIGFFLLTYLAMIWGVSRLELDGLSYFGLDKPVNIGTRPAVLYGVAALLFGGQILSMGVIAELFVAYQNRISKGYSIKNVAGKKNPNNCS
ncbi:MAG: glycosyltransferase family 2 protein [Planctomycetaceae bacterium]|jgi:dolichol-phosphate mannosyltransferase|nr:glycosyltransferase family 2 protein [Planctomycetaceae bacterium]